MLVVTDRKTDRILLCSHSASWLQYSDTHDESAIEQVGVNYILNEHCSSCYPGGFRVSIIRSVIMVGMRTAMIVFHFSNRVYIQYFISVTVSKLSICHRNVWFYGNNSQTVMQNWEKQHHDDHKLLKREKWNNKPQARNNSHKNCCVVVCVWLYGLYPADKRTPWTGEINARAVCLVAIPHSIWNSLNNTGHIGSQSCRSIEGPPTKNKGKILASSLYRGELNYVIVLHVEYIFYE